MEEKDIMTITKNVVANFIDDEDKFIKQQTIDHIIQNGKYYDVISISKARVKKIVENGLKYEQLKKENKDLKSSQNKVAIEKLEELFDILNENITDFTDVGKSKYCWLCIEEFNKNFNSIIAELKGGNDE